MIYIEKAKYLMVIIMVSYIFSTAVNSVYGASLSDGNLTEGNISSDSVKEDWLSESEKKAYEEAMGREYKQKVIATYGKLPKLETEKQKLNWFNNLSAITEGIRNKMLPYIYPKGPAVSYGYNYKDYIEVMFEENLTIDKTLMNETYAIIDEEARKRGIQEVPVEFTVGGIPKEENVTSSSQNGKTTPQIGKTTSTQPDENSTEKSIPGFGLFAGLISILCGLFFIRHR